MASVPDAVKGVFMGLSESVQNSPMEESAKGATMTMIGQLFVMIDLINGLMVNVGMMANEKLRMEADIKGVLHSTGVTQGAVEALVKQSEAKRDGGGRFGGNVLESKSVANIKTLGSDKTSFRTWHEKVVNVMEQLRPGSRGLFKALTK